MSQLRLVPLLFVLFLGCWRGISVQSVKDPTHVFTRRPVHIVVEEFHRDAELTKGLVAPLGQAFGDAHIAATVTYNERLALHPVGLQELRSEDGGGYGLLVRISLISTGGGSDKLIYSAELFDLGTGNKVWKSLIDMGGYTGIRRGSLFTTYSKALIGRAQSDGVLL
jgi:hypothetical protein